VGGKLRVLRLFQASMFDGFDLLAQVEDVAEHDAE